MFTKFSLSKIRAGSLQLKPHYPPVNQKPHTYNQLEGCLALLVEGRGHRATKTNINTGLRGTAGQDSRAGILIGMTDRSHNKPYSVFLRSRCLPPGVNNQEALCSVGVYLCFISPFVLLYIHQCLCSSGPSWSNWTQRHQRTQRLTGEAKNPYLLQRKSYTLFY